LDYLEHILRPGRRWTGAWWNTVVGLANQVRGTVTADSFATIRATLFAEALGSTDSIFIDEGVRDIGGHIIFGHLVRNPVVIPRTTIGIRQIVEVLQIR